MAFPLEALDHSSARDALKKVYERAAVDPEFRQKALNHPKSALEEVTGKRLGIGASKIRFQESGSADLALTLPELYREGDELSEEALDMVAGGSGGDSRSDDEWSG